MITQKINIVFASLLILTSLSIVSAYGDHPKVEVDIPQGASVPACAETNECYISSKVTVDKGGEIIWTNNDVAVHTVTAGAITDDATGVNYTNGFDSKIFAPGQTFTQKFEVAGEYPYFCIVHPWMIGSVLVTSEGGHDDDMTHGDDDKMMHDDDMTHGDDDMTHGDDDKMMHDDDMTHGDDDKMMHDDDMTHGDDNMTNIKYSMMEITSMDDIMVHVSTTGGSVGNPLSIEVEFQDTESLSLAHVKYEIVAMQDGNILLEESTHEHTGMGSHNTPPLTTSAQDVPVDVVVTLKSIGHTDEPYTGPTGVVAQYKAVPEFGTIAIMILAVAIVSIIAINSRMNIISRI